MEGSPVRPDSSPPPPRTSLAAGLSRGLVWTLLAAMIAAACAAWWLMRPSRENVALRRAIEARLASAPAAPGNRIAEAAHEFYRRRGGRGAWSDGRCANDDAIALAGFLSRADREGLDPALYLSPALSHEIE